MKLPDDQKEAIRIAYADGAAQRDLAIQFGVSQSYVSKICAIIQRAPKPKPVRVCIDCETPIHFKRRCPACNAIWQRKRDRQRYQAKTAHKH